MPNAQKLIADNGGKYVAGGFNKTWAMTGAEVILQFDNMDKIKAWYDQGGGRDIERKVGDSTRLSACSQWKAWRNKLLSAKATCGG